MGEGENGARRGLMQKQKHGEGGKENPWERFERGRTGHHKKGERELG